MGINITIDGTAGSGKGTVAKKLAKILNFYCLDTGAIYRSIAYKVIKQNFSLLDRRSIEDLMRYINFVIAFERDDEGNQVQKNILDGEDLGNKIRTEEISKASSLISQLSFVRDFATKIQHDIAKKYDIIIEGRDIGTVILPNADCKFFLTASSEVRARRRMAQLNLPEEKYDEILADIKERDYQDSTRELCPLKAADDAFLIDNSNQTIEETLQTMLDNINRKDILPR